MLDQEYLRILETLSLENLLDFSKTYFLQKYKGVYISVQECEWDHTYIFSIHKESTDSPIQRLVHISCANDNFIDFFNQNISKIAILASNKIYRRIECIFLSKCNTIDKLIEKADIEYGISMSIYNEEQLRNDICNDEILKECVTSFSKKDYQPTLKFDKKNKILYELFTTSSNIVNIKNSFIGSYIEYYLLEKGPLRMPDLKRCLEPALPNLPELAFDEAIRRSKDQGNIQIRNGIYELNEGYKKQLEEIQIITNVTEQRLIEQFEECLNKYGLKELSQEIFNTIIRLYTAQNQSELANLNNNEVPDFSERKIVISLLSSFINKGINNERALYIVKEILNIISDSEYLNKICKTALFTNLFNSNSLEDYLGKQKRIIFLDTQILLQLICLDYQDVPYEDSLYEAGKILLKLKRSSC